MRMGQILGLRRIRILQTNALDAITGAAAMTADTLAYRYALTVTVCGSIALMVLVNLEAVMRH